MPHDFPTLETELRNAEEQRDHHRKKADETSGVKRKKHLAAARGYDNTAMSIKDEIAKRKRGE